jgi:hypothetical protein
MKQIKARLKDCVSHELNAPCGWLSGRPIFRGECPTLVRSEAVMNKMLTSEGLDRRNPSHKVGSAAQILLPVPASNVKYY